MIYGIILMLLVAACGIFIYASAKNQIKEQNKFKDEKEEIVAKPFIQLFSGICGIIFIITFTLSSFYMIKPGEVGIVVDLFGSKQGVDKDELNVGMHFIAPWKTLYRFPVFEQNHQWDGADGFNFQTSEGLSVTADIGITFSLEPTHVHQLFAKYRRGIDEITHLFIKNTLRDAINKVASRMKIEDLYGSKKEDFFVEVHSIVYKELEPIGFNVSRIFIIGKFAIPEVVMEALNKKIEATQRAQQRENELREAEAQAKKEIATAEGKAKAVMIDAKSRADANDLLSKSLTKDIIKWQALNKWDGKLPGVVGANTDILLNFKGE